MSKIYTFYIKKHLFTDEEHKSTMYMYTMYICTLNNTKLIYIGKCTLYSFVHVHFVVKQIFELVE